MKAQHLILSAVFACSCGDPVAPPTQDPDASNHADASPDATPSADEDNDGTIDAADNCIEVANADQTDSDSDGFGNACDADFDNDGWVSQDDLDALSNAIGGSDLSFDLDGDGAVSAADELAAGTLLRTNPGPSAVGPDWDGDGHKDPFQGALAMSMHTTQGFDDWQANYDRGEALGAGAMQVILPWDLFEPNGTDGYRDIVNDPLMKEYVGLLAIPEGAPILLTIAHVDGDAPNLPEDLVGQRLDSEAVKLRLFAAIDHILSLSVFAGRVTHLSLGNEVNYYFEKQAQLDGDLRIVDEFQVLHEQVITYVHEQYPGIDVGVTLSTQALGPHQLRYELLNRHSDVVILNHYGNDTSSDFAALPPENIYGDLARMLAFAGERQLVIQEIGYPSSAALGGSQELQAEFVTHLLRAWRFQGSQRMPLVSYFKQKDWVPQFCHRQACGANLDDDGLCISTVEIQDRFIAYLCSLGLLESDGTQKLGWQTLTTVWAEINN